jgi:poly-beta-1,6-N-acetyl-D-glucosamine synthase
MVLLSAGMILFVLYALLIGLYSHWWKKLPEAYNVSAGLDPGVFLSVIVPARNEEKSLPFLLSALETQSYPGHQFEVIVVDDGSTDGTASMVKEKAGANIRLLSINGGSKKKAIEAGIASARGQLIVTTDADCIPPQNWLLSIADFYKDTGAAFIAAPVKYTPRKTALDYFQTLDFLTLQGITAASVSSGFHSMCNGANLAYERSAFFAVNGFAGIDHLASGDDMLLMHKIKKAFPGRVRYKKAYDAIVETLPMQSWKDLFWQRIRWASKSAHYGDPKIFLSLLLVYLVNLYFFVLVIAGFWNNTYWSLAVTAWILKFAIELPFVYSVAKFYEQLYLLRWFFLMQPIHIIYTVVVGLLSQSGSYYWKGRKLK